MPMIGLVFCSSAPSTGLCVRSRSRHILRKPQIKVASPDNTSSGNEETENMLREGCQRAGHLLVAEKLASVVVCSHTCASL